MRRSGRRWILFAGLLLTFFAAIWLLPRGRRVHGPANSGRPDERGEIHPVLQGHPGRDAPLATTPAAPPDDGARLTVRTPDGQPVEAASVTVHMLGLPQVSMSGPTDGAGTLDIAGLQAGPYRISVSHPGFSPVQLVRILPHDVAITLGTGVGVTVDLTGWTDAVLPGKVVLTNSAADLVRVKEASGRSRRLDFGLFPPGLTTLQYDSPGLHQSWRYVLPDAGTVELDPEPVSVVTVTLRVDTRAHPPPVSWSLEWCHTRMPCAIERPAGGLLSPRDLEVGYTLHVEAGKYLFRVDGTGFAPTFASVALESGSAPEGRVVVLRPAPGLILGWSTDLAPADTDIWFLGSGADRLPASGVGCTSSRFDWAEIRMKRPQILRLDAEAVAGGLSCRVPSIGRVRLEGRNGRGTFISTVNAEGWDGLPVQPVFVPTAQLRVHRADGSPIDGPVTLSRLAPDGTTQRLVHRPFGPQTEVVLDDLPFPTSYLVEYAGAGGRFEAIDTVEDSGVHRMALTPAGSGTRRMARTPVVVVDEDRDPVVGALVGVSVGSAEGEWAKTDGDGRALVTVAEGESALVSAWAEGFAEGTIDVMGGRPVEILLRKVCSQVVLYDGPSRQGSRLVVADAAGKRVWSSRIDRWMGPRLVVPALPCMSLYFSLVGADGAVRAEGRSARSTEGGYVVTLR